jgi:hypothetical protein
LLPFPCSIHLSIYPSTRVRKKARYQELLDQEEQLKQINEAEELKSQRCQSIQDFLLIRQRMLVNANDDSTTNHENYYSGPGNNRNSGESSSSEDDEKEEQAAARQQVKDDTLLSEVVENLSDFRFESKIPGGSEAVGGEVGAVFA